MHLELPPPRPTALAPHVFQALQQCWDVGKMTACRQRADAEHDDEEDEFDSKKVADVIHDPFLFAYCKMLILVNEVFQKVIQVLCINSQKMFHRVCSRR